MHCSVELPSTHKVHETAESKLSMPSLLNFCRKYGWQLIMNDDLVEDTVEHYQLTLEGAHTLCRAPPHARVF
jgi:hypothetical protein